jgi:uncharacterized membrane protein
MPQLSQAKMLGGMGALLMLLVLMPPLGWAVSLAGSVMVLLAVKYISEIVQDRSMYTNMVIAIILEIAGLVMGLATVLDTILNTIGLGVFIGYYWGLPSFLFPSGLLTGNLSELVFVAVVIWVIILTSALLVKRSYESVSKRLGVGMFETVGLLYLVGAAFTIVLVGLVLLLVALILNIVAFYSMPDQPLPKLIPQTIAQPRTT